jgi:hypothetical protein
MYSVGFGGFMDMSYSVGLQGIDDLPPAERAVAERRFTKELEKVLGGAAAVVATYKAWKDASENDSEEVTAEAYSMAVKWPKAFQAAQRTGLQNIGDGDAHFEIRLERQHMEAN